MPLLDHFRPPLSTRRHWHAFHNSWATYLAAALNRQLPDGYFAEANVQFGSDTALVEVLAYREGNVRDAVGVLKLVAPPNKDRGANRTAFVLNCLAHLRRQVGVLLVDIVTEPRGDLHAELVSRLGVGGLHGAPSELYATAYQPHELKKPMLGVWVESLTVGQPLPTLPLWLRGGVALPVELEETYTRTCQEQRVPANGV